MIVTRVLAYHIRCDGRYCNRKSSPVLDASSNDAARHQTSNLGWRTEPEQCPACRTRKRKAS